MSVTIGAWYRISASIYRLTFSSDRSNPTFYVYSGGVSEGVTKSGYWDFVVKPGEEITVAVVDEPTEIPETWPSGVTLGWHIVSGAAYYRIDKYVSDAWVRQADVYPDGTGFLRWISPELEDVTDHRYRVVPVSAAGNEGTGLDFYVFFVRVPDVPDVSIAYSGGNIVIS